MPYPDPDRLYDSKFVDQTDSPLVPWADSGTKIKPPGAKITNGWQLSERPPHEWFNWLEAQLREYQQYHNWQSIAHQLTNWRLIPDRPRRYHTPGYITNAGSKIAYMPERGIWCYVCGNLGTPRLSFVNQGPSLDGPIINEVVDWASVAPASYANENWFGRNRDATVPNTSDYWLCNNFTYWLAGGPDLYVERMGYMGNPAWAQPTGTTPRSLAYDANDCNAFSCAGGRRGTAHENYFVMAGYGQFYSIAYTAFICYSTDQGINWQAVPVGNLPATYASYSASKKVVYDPWRELWYILTEQGSGIKRIWYASDPAGVWQEANYDNSTPNGWTAQTMDMDCGPEAVMVCGYGPFVGGQYSNAMRSTDGINYSFVQVGTGQAPRRTIRNINGACWVCFAEITGDIIEIAVTMDNGKNWHWTGERFSLIGLWDTAIETWTVNAMEGPVLGAGQIALLTPSGIAVTPRVQLYPNLGFGGYDRTYHPNP